MLKKGSDIIPESEQRQNKDKNKAKKRTKQT